jgi:hypothetical protein
MLWMADGLCAASILQDFPDAQPQQVKVVLDYKRFYQIIICSKVLIVSQDPMNDDATESVAPRDSNDTKALSNRLPEVVPTGVPNRLRLQVSEGRATFEVPARCTIVIGRSSSSGPVEVDLSPYNAVDLGISRRHVQLDVVGDRLMIKDLQSVNGSSLNGVPLTPNHYYPVTHGDELKIGRLKMRIFFLYDG